MSESWQTGWVSPNGDSGTKHWLILEGLSPTVDSENRIAAVSIMRADAERIARLMAAAPDLLERVRQMSIRIEWLREAHNALAATMPGKYAYDHPLFALRRAVSALSLQAEMAAADLLKAAAGGGTGAAE
jgi:hypothetical protein